MQAPTECYVALLDILGFGNFVMTRKPDFVQKYLTNLVTVSKTIIAERFKIEYGFDMSIFSDSIVISVPVETFTKTISDRIFLLAMNTLLMTNIVEDRLGHLPLRGAITKGSFYTNSRDVIFGQALVKAHEMESKTAINPRVLVDTQEFTPEDAKNSTAIINDLLVKSGLDKKLSSGLIDFKEQANDRCRDTDGLLFCNYLSSLYNISNGTWVNEAYDFLNRHRIFILKNLDEANNHEKSRSKYTWMAKYHNWFCSGFPEMNDLKVEL